MKIVIVGNGISGITAARSIRKMDSQCEITVISAETKYFFSRTALMYVYMGHMKFEHTKPYEDFFWKKNRIDLVHDYVSKIDFSTKQLFLEKSPSISYDKLLLATGSKPNKFGWPGQDLDGVQGLYSYHDLQLLEKNTHAPSFRESNQRVKRAIIVGGGLIGVELAEMLMTRNIAVTFLILEENFWGNVLPKEEGQLVANHLISHGVELRFETELSEIVPDSGKRVKSVITNKGEEIACEFVGLTAGVSPSIEFLRTSTLSMNKGILVDRELKTNEIDVFAAGDCVEFIEPPKGRNKIEQVWYTGRMMGEIAAVNMLGNSVKYDPGPWFNSAKFFDIEYQTYGKVSHVLSENEKSFYWENSEGDKCLKIVMSETDRRLIGINVFGIRIRHEFMDEMLRNHETADYLLTHWKKALFDPEFYKDSGNEIIGLFNEQFDAKIENTRQTWIEKLIS